MKGGFTLKAIKQKLTLLSLLSFLSTVIVLFFLIKEIFILKNSVRLNFIVIFLIALTLLILLIYQYNKFKTAKLILESKILHIESAKIEEETNVKDNGVSFVDGIEVYISCFGILLGSKVIKFNIDKIILKKIEVDSKYICFTYSSNKKTKMIKILHGSMNKYELQNFIERFSYETGIVPILFT